MSDPSSRGSAGSTSGSSEPDGGMSSSASPTPSDEMSSEPASPESPSTKTYAIFRLSGDYADPSFVVDTMPMLTASPMSDRIPYVFSAEDSPARTCPSPDDEQGSEDPVPVFSTSSLGSPSLFDPDDYSSRTYPGSSPRTAVGTSESCLPRWPTSGTAWAGGFSTAASSECRSADDECSSSECSLTAILQPPQDVPARYSLSARAATGILRRAAKRGRTLPSHLSQALAAVARTTTTDREGE